MSRGFVKEGDQEEPIVIPPRAILPDGVINYVTPDGYAALQAELDGLENDYVDISIENETDLRREQHLIHGKIKLLKERMSSARVLKPEDQSQDEVRFGATVRFKNKAINSIQEITIVGVDEANVSKNKIAFITPIAKAISGSKKGEVIDFKLGDEIRVLEILDIQY